MKKMADNLKHVVKYLVILVFFASCTQKSQNEGISIKNSLDFDRNELVSIPYSEFSKLLGEDIKEFKILNKDGKQYAYQLELLGKNEPQNILIQVDIPAKEELQLVVEAGKPDSFSNKTFGRYVPERFDDFAWENDVLAFRMYGKALEGRKDDAQGMDIWAKRTNKLIVNEWYKTEDYHKDHGDGLDYYSVGQTLGAGDVAPYSDGVVHYPNHYRKYEVLDNGPLRTTFKLDFESWKVDNADVVMSKTISLDAGSQLNKVVLDFDITGKEDLTIAAGIAKRDNGGEVLDKHKDGVFGYWEPEHGEDGIIGVGLIFDNPIDSVVVDEAQFLSLFQVKSKTPVVYHTGGAWNKAGKIQSAADWLKYLEQYKSTLKTPLEVKIN